MQTHHYFRLTMRREGAGLVVEDVAPVGPGADPGLAHDAALACVLTAARALLSAASDGPDPRAVPADALTRLGRALAELDEAPRAHDGESGAVAEIQLAATRLRKIADDALLWSEEARSVAPFGGLSR